VVLTMLEQTNRQTHRYVDLDTALVDSLYFMIKKIDSECRRTVKTRSLGLSHRFRQQTRPSTTTTTRFVDNTIDLLWRNFLNPKFGTVPEGSTLIFGDT